MINSISVTRVAATLTTALGAAPPAAADAPIPAVQELLQRQGIRKVRKLLIYSPDAAAMWLYQKYTPQFLPVQRHVQLSLPMRTVLPSVTPVCFSSIYSGVEPAVHGLQRYEKRRQPQETIFDVLPAAGLRVGLLVPDDSSMSILFTGRPIDYYVLPTDEAIVEKGIELLQKDQYDVLVVYNMDYDTVMHRTGTESEQSLQVLQNHIRAFDRVCSCAESCWAGYDTLLCWITDHGVHDMNREEIREWNRSGGFQVDENGGPYGNHGSAREEDLNVMHFYGAWKGKP